MNTNVVEIFKDWVVVEYLAQNFIQRKFVPRELVQTSIKGPVELDSGLVAMGINVSDADVESVLGTLFNLRGTTAFRIQDKLRRAGFWSVSSYEKNPMAVRRILNGVIDAPVDVALFNNELRRRIL